MLVDRALATWTRAAGGRFVLQKAASRDAALVRVWFAQADGIYGETAPRIDRATGFIGSAEVLIAGDIAGDAVQQRIVIYLTALHELGHALGLPHTDAFDDIMYSFRRPDDGRAISAPTEAGCARARTSEPNAPRASRQAISRRCGRCMAGDAPSHFTPAFAGAALAHLMFDASVFLVSK